MSNTSYRTQRLADTLRKELANVIKFKLKDPRIGMVTINDVKVSRDLAFANIYITSLTPDGADHNKSCVEHLDKASGYIRSELAQSLSVRKLPKLRFFYDDQLVHAEKMAVLIQKALDSDNKQ